MSRAASIFHVYVSDTYESIYLISIYSLFRGDVILIPMKIEWFILYLEGYDFLWMGWGGWVEVNVWIYGERVKSTVVWIKKYLTKRSKVTSLSNVSGEGMEAFLEQNEKYRVKNQAETAILMWLFAKESDKSFGFYHWF